MRAACCVGNGARSKCRATPTPCSQPPSHCDGLCNSPPLVFRPPSRIGVTTPLMTRAEPSEHKAGDKRGRTGKRGPRRIFVLDTNVLMHDPTAIFRFDEHD